MPRSVTRAVLRVPGYAPRLVEAPIASKDVIFVSLVRGGVVRASVRPPQPGRFSIESASGHPIPEANLGQLDERSSSTYTLAPGNYAVVYKTTTNEVRRKLVEIEPDGVVEVVFDVSDNTELEEPEQEEAGQR